MRFPALTVAVSSRAGMLELELMRSLFSGFGGEHGYGELRGMGLAVVVWKGGRTDSATE